jgi:hypothetical protein
MEIHMAFNTPQSGEVQMLNLILNKATQEELTLKLFSSNTTPGEADTAATYTECSGSGYAAIPLAHASFTVTAGNPSTFAYSQQTFTLTGSLTAYGYMIVGTTSNTLYFSEVFGGGPYVIPAGGGTIKVTLNGSM